MTTFYQRLTGKNRSASQAKDRLRLVLINDRSGLTALELEEIKNEILQVLSRHIDIDPASVKIQMNQDGREQRLIADIPIRTTVRKKIGVKQMRSQTWRNFDYILFGAVLILIIFGIAMIRSAIAGNVVLTPLINRQIIFAAVSLVVIFITAAIDYHYWSSLIRPMYLITVVALAALTIVGQAIYGSARWFDTGVILIQPSELAKIVLILVLADYFAHSRDKPHNLRWIGQSFLTMAFIAGWIAAQPNLSTTIVMIVLWFALLWLSGLPTKYLIAFLVIGIIAAVAVFPLLEPYQQGRIVNFLLPAETAARQGDTYNIDQARITIGSGGWTGMGYGLGTQVQLRFLKVRHTDFIFSAIGEEFGFLGMVALLGLLLLVILRCLRAARLSQDAFGSFIAYGFTVLILFQAAVNIGVNLNILPVTGLTLPFVSYGGSSLLSLSLGIGLVESVILRHKPT